MRNKGYLVLILVWLAASVLCAQVQVTAVRGTVGVMSGSRLQPVSVGMSLTEDATIVTGANSEVSIRVNNGTITLKSLTTARINSVALSDTSSNADVALRNGTVVSNVQQIQGLRTNFTVTTPVATSSVRGTTHTVSFSPEQGMRVEVTEGLVAIAAARGTARAVGSGSSYQQGTSATAQPQVDSSLARAGSPIDRLQGSDQAAGLAATSSLPAALQDIYTIASNATPSGSVTIIIEFP